MARSATYFGRPDASAATPEELTARHVFRDIEDRLKWNTRTSGIQVVVGIKGSGKTELRRYLESRTNAYIFNLDADHAFFSQDVSTINDTSGRTKNAIAAILLREFANRVAKKHSPKVSNALKNAYETSTSMFKNIPKAIDVGIPGVVQLRLGELIKPGVSGVLQDTTNKLVTDVIGALHVAGQPGSILIDDVEDVFNGIEKNPLFLEGIVRAVEEINRRGSNSIHVLMFVKHGHWRAWFDAPKEYDRVSDVIGFLTWDHEALVELIAKRIAYRHNIDIQNQSLDVEAMWAKEFSWTGELDDFTRYCTQYCVSGPRDMVVLCNLAGVRAGNDPISRSHIEAILGAYSKGKIGSLIADFGDTYPEVNKFVEQVFQGASARMTGRQLAELIYNRVLITPRVHNEFKDKHWYRYATEQALATTMYQVGVVGLESADGIIYAIEQPDLSDSDLLDGVVCVHPAFRPGLTMEPSGP